MRSLFTVYTDFNFDTVERCGFIKTKKNNFIVANDMDVLMKNCDYQPLYWVDYETENETRIMHVVIQLMTSNSHTIIIDLPETNEELVSEFDACSTMTELNPLPPDIKHPRDVLGRIVRVGDTIRCKHKRFIVETMKFMGIPNRELAKKFGDDGWFINNSLPLYLCEIIGDYLESTMCELLKYKNKIPIDLFNKLYLQKTIDNFQDILFEEKETIPDGIYLDLQNALKRDHF